jgi:hypothetical protein
MRLAVCSGRSSAALISQAMLDEITYKSISFALPDFTLAD